MARICVICGQEHCGHAVAPRYQPLSLERQAVPMHKLKQDTYVDIDGNVVDPTDPKVQTFVGAKGFEIPEEDARRYGLIGGKHEAAAHDADHDPANAADPVVGGEPMALVGAKGADPADAPADDETADASKGARKK